MMKLYPCQEATGVMILTVAGHTVAPAAAVPASCGSFGQWHFSSRQAHQSIVVVAALARSSCLFEFLFLSFTEQHEDKRENENDSLLILLT